MYENVHPNLALVLLFERTEVECGKSLSVLETLFAVGFPYTVISEDLVVTWKTLEAGCGIHILDSKTGETRHVFLEDHGHQSISGCKFVGDGKSLACCSRRDNFLRLFNVRSGDLLSVLDIGEESFSLGACLGKSLVAIGLLGARLKFIHVELPSIKDAEEKKG